MLHVEASDFSEEVTSVRKSLASTSSITRFMVPWDYLASDFEFCHSILQVQTLVIISYCLQIGVRGSVTLFVNCTYNNRKEGDQSGPR